MKSGHAFHLVRLANGTFSIRSVALGETFHPGIGPVAEAQALYIQPLRLEERFRQCHHEFVVWDVGLGAAANALTVLRATGHLEGRIRLVSFDHTLEPLEFAWQHADRLGYFHGYEEPVRDLIRDRCVKFTHRRQTVNWELRLADFPTLIAARSVNPHSQGAISPAELPPPDAILFDAYSPAKNPAMWTEPLFANLYRRLDALRPCSLATYSRSTMLRVALLVAGFYVGRGAPTGAKEETTVAANTTDLIGAPLDKQWLRRARQSTSAEPLWEPVYRQASLAAETWAQLHRHPQFTA